MEPAEQILSRNLHDHSPFRQQGFSKASVKKIHGDFLKIFRGTFKSHDISGVILGASSNTEVFQEFQGSLTTLVKRTLVGVLFRIHFEFRFLCPRLS